MNPEASPSPHKTIQSFRELDLLPELMKVLEQRKFTTPTPIQAKSIVPGLEGKDLIGIAQTGTGKTLAFGLPMLQRLKKEGGRGLIVVPTRELAAQVEESLRGFGAPLGILTAVFVGGASMQKQREMLKRNPRILVATPGRLNDHLQQGTVSLNEVKVLVLDEADHMFDMGFKPQIERIISKIPKQRQTLLFSATMPQEIVGLATKHMVLPLRIEVAPAGTAATQVEQEVFIVKKENKMQLLLDLLKEYSGQVLVFSRTKHGAKKMTSSLNAAGHRTAEIHANKSLNQRREALDGFKARKYRVLVATDIAARGIHVTGIELVVSYDLPDDPSNYVHRIGRTGRAGHAGRAISFATPDQHALLKTIERLLRGPISRRAHALALAQMDTSLTPENTRHQSRGGGGGFHKRGGSRPTGRKSGGRSWGKAR